jgi:hypothetical protein
MKNFRYAITVLALLNIGLATQAAAASVTTSTTKASVSQPVVSANRIIIGTE